MVTSGLRNLHEIENVFLDRDGVINRPPAEGEFVTSCEQLDLLPGVPEAIASLNKSGRRVIVATNQRGIALGLFSQAELQRLHQHLQTLLAERGARLDAIYCCPHDRQQCDCRKPLPGLFQQAFRDFPGAGSHNSVMIGDSLSDMEAGANLKMATVFISRGQSATADTVRAAALANGCADSLAEFVERFLGGSFQQ